MNPQGVSGDIFSSQTDQGTNSFRDPMNTARNTPGWGMNTAYQTPYYDAMYRPAYQGPNPYAAYQKPGFFGAANQLFNPGYKDPYWGNPVDNNQQAYHSLATRPVDAGMTALQRFFMPAFVMAGTQRVLGGMATGLGSGFATGLGAGAGVAGAAGWAAGLALPMAVGLGVSAAVDRAVFQPYIRSRQMSEIAQQNFSGVTFGGGGNAISGRGLSGASAAGIGSGIDRFAMQDMTFGSNQIHSIASMGMRAGLFDDVGSSGDIVKRAGSIASQIKMIVAISKDPNIQSAIEALSSLRMGGASISGGYGSVATGAYSGIGMAASAAGMSVQKIMSGVGAQGQYMFQMSGLTPYLGQMSAANAMSGFASASRQGILSTAQMARMGGLEGATQSSLGAQISASSTVFNRMGLMNNFMGRGGNNGSVVGTVGAFGGHAAMDPLGTAGNMGLYGNALISNQMKTSDGLKSAETQAIKILESTGRRAGPGGHDAGAIFSVMQGMGIPADQIQAYFSLRASQTNPDVVAQNIRAFKAQTEEQIRQQISQDGLYQGVIMGSAASVKRGVLSAFGAVGNVTGQAVNRMTGMFEDTVTSAMDKLMFGSNKTENRIEGTGDTYDIDLVKARKNSSRGSGFFSDDGYSSNYKILEAINKAASGQGEGSEHARKLLASGFDSDEGKDSFTKFLAAQTDHDMQDAYSSLSRSTGVYTGVATLARGAIRRHEDKTRLIPKADLAIMDQAADVHLLGGAMAMTLEKTLDDPRYAELARSISTDGHGKKLTVDEKVSKIRTLARGRVTAGGWDIGDSASDESVNGMLSKLRGLAKATAEAQQNASSGVNYKQFADAMSSIDSGAALFYDAVRIFADTQGVKVPARPTGGSSGKEGQKNVGAKK